MTNSNDQVNWYIDEGVPGTGTRPSWLPDKFKTVADMARSNAELEKKLGTIPEEYDFSNSKYIKDDYQPFQELKSLAREKRVPKEVIDKMVNSFDKYISEITVDEAAEIKKLGDGAQDRITTLDNWAKANLSKESYETLSKIRTANGIKAIEELRGKMMTMNPQIPNGNGAGGESTATVKELQDEIVANFEKYKTDAEYRKNMERRITAAVKGSTEYVDKIGA